MQPKPAYKNTDDWRHVPPPCRARAGRGAAGGRTTRAAGGGRRRVVQARARARARPAQRGRPPMTHPRALAGRPASAAAQQARRRVRAGKSVDRDLRYERPTNLLRPDDAQGNHSFWLSRRDRFEPRVFGQRSAADDGVSRRPDSACGFLVSDPASKILNPGPWIHDQVSRTPAPGSAAQGPGSWSYFAGTWILEVGS